MHGSSHLAPLLAPQLPGLQDLLGPAANPVQQAAGGLGQGTPKIEDLLIGLDAALPKKDLPGEKKQQGAARRLPPPPAAGPAPSPPTNAAAPPEPPLVLPSLPNAVCSASGQAGRQPFNPLPTCPQLATGSVDG
jgi:hypothetical protein